MQSLHNSVNIRQKRDRDDSRGNNDEPDGRIGESDRNFGIDFAVDYEQISMKNRENTIQPFRELF